MMVFSFFCGYGYRVHLALPEIFKKLNTSCPVDSRPRELSPYYWPLPLRVVQTTPLFPLDDTFFHKHL